MTEEQRKIAELFVAEESIALYRLPFSDEFTVVVQDRRKATSETDGFVMMPFAESEAHPTVVISPDRVINCKFRVEDNLYHTEKEIENVIMPDECYNSAFEKFSKALNDGIFEKLVLSRCEKIPFENVDAFGSFLKACVAYPRMMVYLAKTPTTGIWLGCTPEILLSGEKSHYRTVALAGTMAADGNDIRNLVWSEKNKEEQWIEHLSLAEAMKKLNPREHEIITMRFFEGKTQPEDTVCRICLLPVGSKEILAGDLLPTVGDEVDPIGGLLHHIADGLRLDEVQRGDQVGDLAEQTDQINTGCGRFLLGSFSFHLNHGNQHLLWGTAAVNVVFTGAWRTEQCAAHREINNTTIIDSGCISQRDIADTTFIYRAFRDDESIVGSGNTSDLVAASQFVPFINESMIAGYNKVAGVG